MSQQQDIRNKRYMHTLQIRKDKLEEKLNKRRNMEIEIHPTFNSNTMTENQLQFEQGEQKPILIVDQRYYAQIQELINAEYDDSMFDELAEDINNSDVMRQHRGVVGMRKLLARNVDPPIRKFIDKGLTNKCMWLAKQKQYPQIRLESTWILTNVASGETRFCDRLVERGGIDLFIGLLQENEKGLVDQAIWGIGNIAADNVKHRDQILRKGGLEALVKVIQNTKNKQIIRTGAWAVTNLCRGTPVPDQKYIKEACPLLCKVIKSGALNDNNSKQILSDVIWAISLMTQGSKSRIERVNKFQILNEVFQFVRDPWKNIFIPALRIIGNFSNGNENHTDQLIKHGVFDLAMALFDHPKKPIRKEICWILSNIAAGATTQVEAFISRVDLLDRLALLFHQDVPDVQREICWVYGNLGHLGDRHKLLEIYLHYDIMRVFSNLLHQEDAETLENALETLYKILSLGKKCQKDGKNLVLMKFLEHGGGPRLEALQLHQNKEVYNKTLRILTKFFELEDNAYLG